MGGKEGINLEGDLGLQWKDEGSTHKNQPRRLRTSISIIFKSTRLKPVASSRTQCDRAERRKRREKAKRKSRKREQRERADRKSRQRKPTEKAERKSLETAK
eukprot:scaffold96820_cov54-Attheya_sp.AAC.3